MHSWLYLILIAALVAQAAVVQSGSNGSALCDSYGPRIACGGMSPALYTISISTNFFSLEKRILSFFGSDYAVTSREVVEYEADSLGCASRLQIRDKSWHTAMTHPACIYIFSCIVFRLIRIVPRLQAPVIRAATKWPGLL